MTGIEIIKRCARKMGIDCDELAGRLRELENDDGWIYLPPEELARAQREKNAMMRKALDSIPFATKNLSTGRKPASKPLKSRRKP